MSSQSLINWLKMFGKKKKRKKEKKRKKKSKANQLDMGKGKD